MIYWLLATRDEGDEVQFIASKSLRRLNVVADALAREGWTVKRGVANHVKTDFLQDGH